MTDASSEPVRVILVGAGGHAAVVADVARLSGHVVAGFLDTQRPERRGTPYCGATVLGGDERLEELLRAGIRHAVVAIGDCGARQRMSRQLTLAGFTLRTLQHPSAVVAHDALIGPGTVLAAGSIVNPGVVVGASVILNTACSIDHHCRIGDAVHVCPGVHLGGAVMVGAEAWVGIGATVVNGITIGERALVGAGAVVVRDVPPDVVVRGVPARVARRRG